VIQGDLRFENCNLDEKALSLLDGLHVKGDLYLTGNQIKKIPEYFDRLSVTGSVYLSGNPIAGQSPAKTWVFCQRRLSPPFTNSTIHLNPISPRPNTDILHPS